MTEIHAIRIEISPDGTYHEHDGGDMAAEIPIYERPRVMVDFVAWKIRHPKKWWTKHGAALLGEGALVQTLWDGISVNLYETPASWVKANDEWGVCILNWGRNPEITLSGASVVICESKRLAAGLEKKIAHFNKPLFEIRHGK